LVREGKVIEALAAYAEAQTLDPMLKISPQSWNALCWSGSLWGHATEVMNACEQAVTLSKREPYIRDSWALARALTGNFDGVIEDFQAFVDWTNDARKKSQRQRWIKSLQAGENPFTPEEIRQLRQQ
jgi:hypothetical protein